MISIRRSIDEDERFARSFEQQRVSQSFHALVDLFEGLANAIPGTAAPSSPEYAEHCRKRLLQTAELLRNAPSREDIDAAKSETLTQVNHICKSNRLALDERDAALRDVVSTVAGAVSGFKGSVESRDAGLSKLADGFDALVRIEDIAELRRQLRRNVAELRHSVEELHRQSDESLHALESQVRAFEERLEGARTGASKDRLTGLGSRREAERQMREFEGKRTGCVLLFDVEGFGEINSRYGTIFGDRLLQALAQILAARFPDDGTVFRWGADEFLVIAPAPLPPRVVQCRNVCGSFASQRHLVHEGGTRKAVSAALASGAAEYIPGETIEALYRRARTDLEQSRRGFQR